MRLHKCRKVENYLLENNLIDERRIWCYAQMKAKNAYGLALICVNGSKLFIYNSEYNSTKLELFCSCNIDDMKKTTIKKKLMSVRISFVIREDNFILALDDPKRFAGVFEGVN